MRSDFAALILTHNRADRVFTYETLRRHGYTGKIVIVIDDGDPALHEYLERFGREVAIFKKAEIAKVTDPGDNFGGLRGVLYARNASFQVARDLGIKYFIQLDDDYRSFTFRFNRELDYQPKACRNLDAVFSAMTDFLEDSGASSVCMAQGGDFIGGSENPCAEKISLSRKAMNSFVCSVERPFRFMGRINEDVNAYTALGSVGKLFFTTYQVSLGQTQTQTNSGGLTEIYLDLGTFVKSFYSVMYLPSAVKVKVLQDRGNPRLHHSIAWNNCVPKILPESFRKGA